MTELQFSMLVGAAGTIAIIVAGIALVNMWIGHAVKRWRILK